MATPDERADWRRCKDLYKQFNAIIDDVEKTNIPPDDLIGSLAESWGRTFAHYDGDETQFVQDLFQICCDIRKPAGSTPVDQFRSLYCDERLNRLNAYVTGEQRRRPKPFEAAVETSRRLRDLNKVRDELSNLETAAILGGSASYGRFFNTVGALVEDKPSDTDLLLVLPDYGSLPTIITALEKVEAVEVSSLREFAARLDTFSSLRPNQEPLPCIISHKIKLWETKIDPLLEKAQIPSHYKLSLHVFAINDFNYVILFDKPIIECDRSGEFSRYVVDYRDTEPVRSDNQRSFSGRDETVELSSETVDRGHVARVAVCHIREERFYAGLHQNLILPQFEIRWDTLKEKIYLRVLGFRWKVLERLTEERRLRPFEFQTLSLSHTRSAHFAPHITRRANRE